VYVYTHKVCLHLCLYIKCVYYIHLCLYIQCVYTCIVFVRVHVLTRTDVFIYTYRVFIHTHRVFIHSYRVFIQTYRGSYLI
jgi:hypothetical protein